MSVRLPLMREAAQFIRILSDESPVRDPAGTQYERQYTDKNGITRIRRWKMPKEIKRHGVVISPYPGNLKNNGTFFVTATENKVVVKHGYEPARYALYANTTSRKQNYINKTVNRYRSFLFAEGWEQTTEGGLDDL